MALLALWNPNIQFLKTDGTINAGGKIIVTDHNDAESIPANYSDADGTTLNSSPIVLDALGRATCYIDDGSTYDLYVKDANGATLWTVPEMTPGTETIVVRGGFSVSSNDRSVAVTISVDSDGVTNYDLSIQKEIDRAKEAEKGLADSIEAEKKRAEGVESTLSESISKETERAIAAEKASRTEIVAGDNIKVDKTTGEDGHDIYTINGEKGIDAATANPLMDGTAAVGVSTKYAREDHVHPTDTSREDKANKTTVVIGTSNSKYPTDKAVAEFVNSSIATNTANYISNNGEPFTSVEQLEAYSGTVTNNDYAFVTGTDSDGNTYYDRYKATVNDSSVTWALEYRLNNSSFTAAQWSAINSGITSVLVAKIHDHSNKDVLDGITSDKVNSWDGKQDALTFDTTPTAGSSNPVTSDGIKSAISNSVDQTYSSKSTKAQSGVAVNEAFKTRETSGSDDSYTYLGMKKTYRGKKELYWKLVSFITVKNYWTLQFEVDVSNGRKSTGSYDTEIYETKRLTICGVNLGVVTYAKELRYVAQGIDSSRGYKNNIYYEISSSNLVTVYIKAIDLPNQIQLCRLKDVINFQGISNITWHEPVNDAGTQPTNPVKFKEEFPAIASTSSNIGSDSVPVYINKGKPVSCNSSNLKAGKDDDGNVIKNTYATKAEIDTHTGNTTVHITAAERTAWNAKQSALTFDTAPTSGSNNPVTSNGIKKELDTKLNVDGSNATNEGVTDMMRKVPSGTGHLSDESSYFGDSDSDHAKIVRRTVLDIWNYMKGKMSSDTGVNISGNAAAATATLSGSITANDDLNNYNTANRNYICNNTNASSVSNKPSGASGAFELEVIRGTGDTCVQVYYSRDDVNSNYIRKRTGINNSWTDWVKLIDSSDSIATDCQLAFSAVAKSENTSDGCTLTFTAIDGSKKAVTVKNVVKAGNADTVGGYHIVVGSTGTDAKTIYFT